MNLSIGGETLSHMKHLFVKSEGEWLPLLSNEICWVTKSRLKKNYVSIHYDQSDFESKLSLNMISSLLPKEEFIRIHNSYIIRLDKVTKIGSGLSHVKLGNKLIPVGEAYTQKLIELCDFVK